MPNTVSEAITYLNPLISQPAQLLAGLIQLLTTHLEWGSAMIPAYARYLSPADFDQLSQRFPALAPLLNGYRTLAAAA